MARRRRDRKIAVDVDHGLRVRPRAIVGERDSALLELLEEARRLVLVELRLLEELAHRGQVQASKFFTLFQQGL